MVTADIFWNKRSSWREVQAALDHHIRLYSLQNSTLVSLAGSIADNLQAVDQIMDSLCAANCLCCPDPCCLHADVRYDFRDLLFLHCREQGLPLHQPKQQSGRACSFLGQMGCALPRTLRPFLCTWYLCPRQMKTVRDAPSPDMAHFQQRLHIIKEQRKDLEAEFINLVG
ncbi:MAG: hypothetical protein U5L00_06225 [Desulfovermiculus sp.]|nr:hypothetical protein [Desulfovermiculus sp.]